MDVMKSLINFMIALKLLICNYLISLSNRLKNPCNKKYFEDLSNEIEEYYSSIISKDINPEEKDILKICNALKNMRNQIEKFFEENKLHKLYYDNTSFHDISKDNDRLCKFCLIKKVNLSLM